VGTPYIYVIDDTPASVEAATQVLEDEGYKVEPFYAGIAGFNQISEMKFNEKFIRPDLVLSDLDMPIKSGFDIIQAALEIDIPVIIMSANWDAKEECIRKGASGFFKKSLDTPEDLIHKIKRTLEKKGRLTNCLQQQ
jgi:CheY-like chemotaxis protein